MIANEKTAALLRQIKAEWDQAEADIKLAEQVCNKVVIPAIKELRYAGRRLADAISVALSEIGDDAERKMETYIQDACFDCHRARHDAIDTAIAKISIELDIMIKKLGYKPVLEICKEFPSLVSKIEAVKELIANSRKDRQGRDAIYKTIEESKFSEIVSIYKSVKLSEPLMKKMARQDWITTVVPWAIALIGVVVGIGGLVI